MAFIGNTNTTQAFTPAIDYFSGNGSTTAFTLSRPVASVAQVQVVVNNVAQNPSSAYTVSGNTITFTSAPSSGTNNIYVYYTSPITQVVALPQNPQVFGNLQFSSSGARITGDFSNATVANRVAFQTSTVNGATQTIVIPNGSGTVANFGFFNNSDPSNAAGFFVGTANAGTEARLNSTITGTGTYLPMTFYTGGSERIRVDTSGNVGIGTSSPTDRLKVVGGNTQVPRDSLIGSSATGNAIIVGTSGGSQIKFAQNGNNDELAFITHVSGVSHTEQARITGAGLFQFNSGYGSVATAYGCRAWVNFNGTGTVAIRASGNVTSITDNGVGDYTVNFTNAMPDANYGIAITAGGANSGAGTKFWGNVSNLTDSTPPTTTTMRFLVGYSDTINADCSRIQVAIFR